MFLFLPPLLPTSFQCNLISTFVDYFLELDKCKMQHDIAFVLDSSHSMVEQGLVMAESLAVDVLNSFAIGEYETRVGLMQFSKESHIMFHFDTYYTKEEIYLAVTKHDGFNASSVR